ncbi:MAG: murein hydrolase activator EnvC family protein [Actinomycetota bacterium]
MLALVLVAGALATTPALAQTKDELDAVEARLADAEARLSQATAVWQAAESALAQTRDELTSTRAERDQLVQHSAAIQLRLQKRAILAFETGPAGTIDLLLSSSSFTEFSDRIEFLGSMAQADSDLVIEERVTTEQLRRTVVRLGELSEQQAEQAQALQASRSAILATVGDLRETRDELEARYKNELRLLAFLGQNVLPGAPIEVCPVAGPNTFVDSFGWPRSGGRVHMGIDLIAPYGTTIVAAHGGDVTHSSSSLGGIQAYVRASDGTYTFYAHLSGFSSASGSVSAGTVIGYVGSTGNAGVPHLHFEYHPGGGGAINPYQLLLAVC